MRFATFREKRRNGDVKFQNFARYHTDNKPFGTEDNDGEKTRVAEPVWAETYSGITVASYEKRWLDNYTDTT